MIRALVFDFDGLILDTETSLIDAWALVHDEARVACDRAQAHAIVGHVDVAWDMWAAFPASTDRAGLHEAYARHRRAQLLRQEILPGVRPLLEAARDAGVRIGIASNSEHAWVEPHLRRIGLHSFFEVIRCRDDVSQGKPEPEVYLAACIALGVAPAEAVAFEDSVPGHVAAHRAGLAVVVVPNPSTVHCEFPHADLRLASLAETSLDALRSRFAGR